MRIEGYKTGDESEERLESPWRLLSRRHQFGRFETAIQLIDNLNERGIRFAGSHYLPLYWLTAFFVFLLFMLLLIFSGLANSWLGTVLGPPIRITAVFLWAGCAVSVYWDTIAAERYLRMKWGLGKLNAIAAIFVGPLALFFQIGYRIYKI